MKLITVFSAFLMLLSASPVEAETISLKCASTEWVNESGYDKNVEVVDPSGMEPFFMVIDLKAKTASVVIQSIRKKYNLEVKTRMLIVSRGSEAKATQSNPFIRFTVQSDTLAFDSFYLALGGSTGIFTMKTKGQCVRGVIPAGN